MALAKPALLPWIASKPRCWYSSALSTLNAPGMIRISGACRSTLRRRLFLVRRLDTFGVYRHFLCSSSNGRLGPVLRFHRQQPLLARHAQRVAADVAVAAHDAVARHDERHRVPLAGLRDGA